MPEIEKHLQRGGLDPALLRGLTQSRMGRREMFRLMAGIGGAGLTFSGIPLVIDPNMPIAQTVGANTNRSSIIVGAGREAWFLENQGVAMDVSSEAGTSFEQNQTWFRGEQRAGFTAARLTAAFQIVSDVGP